MTKLIGERHWPIDPFSGGKVDGMIVRLLPDPALDLLGAIAAQQAMYYGEPVAHIEAFYLWGATSRKNK